MWKSISIFFASHVYVTRNLYTDMLASPAKSVTGNVHTDIWRIMNLRQHNILIPNKNILMDSNESHLFSEQIPANQLQKSILRCIIFSWECMKLRVRKYLASIELSRFQEYSWAFKGARRGKLCPFQHTCVTTAKLSANWLLAVWRYEAVCTRVQMNK